MFRRAPVIFNTVLNTVFGLPGILALGLLASAALGLALGHMDRATAAAAKTASAANHLTQPVLISDLSRWPQRLPSDS